MLSAQARSSTADSSWSCPSFSELLLLATDEDGTWIASFITRGAISAPDSEVAFLGCGSRTLLGFYNWFSQKVVSCQVTQKSKRGKLLGERGAKIYVLDALFGSVSKTGDEMHDKMVNRKRSTLNSRLHRGEVVKNLTQELGLGILFSSHIW